MENSLTPQFSVSDFLAVVNQSLEVAFGAIYIEGEVASFKVNHQKYVFFDLKDNDGSVGCFMTAWQLRMPIEDGMKVLVRAVPKVTPWGKFSLTVQEIKPVGEGSLRKSFEILKTNLAKEGLFDEERKRSLPTIPTRVGVISSTAAAGYADFMKISGDRFGGVKFVVANVQVQGQSAADQIMRAIDHFNQLSEPPEVLVIIRGGGSADDLAVFNDEMLVRKIAASRVPILTGIGHETDESLADLAADVAAVTPTDAAQVLLPDRQNIINNIKRLKREAIRRYGDEVLAMIGLVGERRMGTLTHWHDRIRQQLEVVGGQKRLIDEYNPERVLARGYALIRGSCTVGELINITTAKEKMKARIESYEER